MNDDPKRVPSEAPDNEPKSEFEDMSEEEFETFLADAIQDYGEENDAPRTRIRTFSEAGVLTNNSGLVVRVGDAEFQVTIVRSR